MPLHRLPDGGALSYEVIGKGPPLLLVAGLSGRGEFWHPLVPALAPHFRLVLHDHRGTGQSSLDRIDYSVEQMADDLLSLMQGLGIERAHLVGHSTGGAIGQTIALDRPERIERLVLSGTWAGVDPYFQRLFEIRRDTLRLGGPLAYLRSNILFLRTPKWIGEHPEAFEMTAEEAAAQIPDPEILERRIAAILRFDRRADLPRIAAETLVIGALDDRVTPSTLAEEIAGLLPRARLVLLPRGGHFFPVEEAEEVGRLLLDFLGA